MKENEILENKNIREGLLSNIVALEKVKKLILLGNSEYATIQQVADYFEVDFKAIETLINRNKNELKENGFGLKKRKDILNILDEGLETKVPNRGMNLFSKRAILNVAMLLRDSTVAKEVRRFLLNITQDALEGKENIKENIILELTEEQKLNLELGEAIASGDMMRVIEANTKMNNFKNKRIKELEEKNEILITHSLTIEDSRKVINAIIRAISQKTGEPYGKCWGRFYKLLNYKLGININGRKKTSKQTKLDLLTDEEMFKAEEQARAWGEENNIDVIKILSI